jgi:hypothetical protein
MTGPAYSFYYDRYEETLFGNCKTHSARPRRYKLRLPTICKKGRGTSAQTATRLVFCEDDLGRAVTLFQTATTSNTGQNKSSNLIASSGFATCPSLTDYPINIALYIVELGQKGTVAAGSLQPSLSSISKYLEEHALQPVALGPLVSRVRNYLANGQEDLVPLLQRLPLPATMALGILEFAEGLLQMVEFILLDRDLPLPTSYRRRHHHRMYVLQLMEENAMQGPFGETLG